MVRMPQASSAGACTSSDCVMAFARVSEERSHSECGDSRCMLHAGAGYCCGLVVIAL